MADCWFVVCCPVVCAPLSSCRFALCASLLADCWFVVCCPVARAIDGNPPLLSRTIYTRALVKAGETVVIGGLMRDDSTDTIEKVPWVSDLPFVGWMFRRTQERDEKSQLMIFITPSILPTPLTKSASIKTAMPKKTSSLLSEKSEVQSDQRTTGPQTTNQQSAISSQPSAKSETQSEKGKKESDNRTTGLQDQEAKRKEQSDDRPQTGGSRQRAVSRTAGSRSKERKATKGLRARHNGATQSCAHGPRDSISS